MCPRECERADVEGREEPEPLSVCEDAAAEPTGLMDEYGLRWERIECSDPTSDSSVSRGWTTMGWSEAERKKFSQNIASKVNVQESEGSVQLTVPNVSLLPSCRPALPPPDKLDQPLSAEGGASSSTSKLIPKPDVLSTAVTVVGLAAELLTTELRHTLTFGSPGGVLREPEPETEPDAALNGDAGRGAGMSSTSMSEYSIAAAIDCGRVAASYVGGLSTARCSLLLCPRDDVDWRTSRCSGDGSGWWCAAGIGGIGGGCCVEPEPPVECVPIELPGRERASKKTVLPLAALAPLTAEIGRSPAAPNPSPESCLSLRPKLSVVGLVGSCVETRANDPGRD